MNRQYKEALDYLALRIRELKGYERLNSKEFECYKTLDDLISHLPKENEVWGRHSKGYLNLLKEIRND